MPQDITINGAQYPDVPAVQIPKTGGGIAQFDDTTDATATASEIASGKSAYVNNTRLVGTGSMVEDPLFIDTAKDSVGVGSAPTRNASFEVDSDHSIVAYGKTNMIMYMPFSFQTAYTSATLGYSRIATVTITAVYPSAGIRFVVLRGNDDRAVELSLRFANENTTDPSTCYLYYDSISGTNTSNPFVAFAHKDAPSVWSIYVSKTNNYDIISVTTYVSDFMQQRCNITYTNDLIPSIPNNVVMATQLPTINTVKYNTFAYMPYSFNAVGTAGSAGYARIATVTVGSTTSAAYTQQAIHFHGIRRTDDTPFDLYFSLYGAASDPPLHAFYANFPINNVSGIASFEAFAYKTASNTWDIYVRKCSGSDQITVWADVPKYAQDGYTITYSQGHQTSVPSGAVMATPVPCLNPTVTVTKTGGFGELNTATLHRSGNVVQLRITVHTTSAVAVGATLLSLTTNAPRPVSYVTATEITGNYVGVGWLNTDGTFSSREAVGEVPTNRYFTFSFTYLTND